MRQALSEFSNDLDRAHGEQARLLTVYDTTAMEMYDVSTGEALLEPKARICAGNIRRLFEQQHAVTEARRFIVKGGYDVERAQDLMEEAEWELEDERVPLAERRDALAAEIKRKNESLQSLHRRPIRDMEEISRAALSLREARAELEEVSRQLVKVDQRLQGMRSAGPVLDKIGQGADAAALMEGLVEPLPSRSGENSRGGGRADDHRAFATAQKIERIWTQDLPATEERLRQAEGSGDTAAADKLRREIYRLNRTVEDLRGRI